MNKQTTPKAKITTANLQTELFLNVTKVSMELTDFRIQDTPIGSIKMGLDGEKKEVFIDAKNSNWKEIIVFCIILFFVLICLILILIVLIKYKAYFSRRKPFGWSYRSNV